MYKRQPVACARALGGVLIGNIIASDDPMATPINKVSTPPTVSYTHLDLYKRQVYRTGGRSE